MTDKYVEELAYLIVALEYKGTVHTPTRSEIAAAIIEARAILGLTDEDVHRNRRHNPNPEYILLGVPAILPNVSGVNDVECVAGYEEGRP